MRKKIQKKIRKKKNNSFKNKKTLNSRMWIWGLLLIRGSLIDLVFFPEGLIKIFLLA